MSTAIGKPLTTALSSSLCEYTRLLPQSIVPRQRGSRYRTALWSGRGEQALPKVVRSAEGRSCCAESAWGAVPVLRSADLAYDFEHWAEHLDNAALLAGAVALQVGREPLLLVPAGGTRRGGTLPVSSAPLGAEVVDLVRDLPGFPDPRLVLATTPWGDHCVVWGEALPAGSTDGEMVRFYGLRSGGNVRALATPAQRQLLWGA